jgi:hypothetical protein
MRSFHRRDSAFLAVVVACSAALACSGEPRRAAGPSLPEWTVSAEPAIVIGKEGDPHYEFSRVSGVAFLPDGGVVVADAGSQEIRVYDATGTYRRTFGGAGEGPGEFGMLGTIKARGDSILAVGQAFRAPARFQVFDAERGYLSGSVLLPPGEPGGVAPRAIVSPTALLVAAGPGWHVVTDLPPEGTLQHDSVTLGIIQVSDTQVVRWIGKIASVEFYSYDLPRGGSVARTIGTYTLGPSLVVGGTSDDRVWIGDGGTGRIGVYDTTGSKVIEFVFPIPARPFDEAALERAREAALARVEDPDRTGWRTSIEVLYSAALRPATVPRFTSFTAGPDGNMWVRLYSELPDAARKAIVLDRNGKAIARATIPAGLGLSAVSRDRIAGVRRDADGVPRIEAHRLQR